MGKQHNKDEQKESVELLTDNPLESEKDPERYFKLDGLKFKEYTEVLARAIRDTQTPFTIGIYGEWGKGKTSFLRMIQYHLDQENSQDKKYLSVWFNAWKYEKDNDPILSLLTVINETLEQNRSFFQKLGDEADEVFTKATTYLKHTILTSLNIKMKLNAKGVDFTNSIDLNKAYLQAKAELEKKHPKDSLNELIFDNSYIKVFEYLKELETSLKEADIHLVVFIDDLDRCLPSNAVSLLESIKLILDLKGFTFVMGIANDVIEGHLEHRYKNEFGLKEGDHGRSYLEKIIQLPFYLPKFSQKMDQLVDNLFNKIDKSEHKITEVKNVINAISNHKKTTPRQLIRIINQANIHARIHMSISGEESKYDIFAAFTFVLLLESLYPNEYEYLSEEAKDIRMKVLSYDLEEKKDEDQLKQEPFIYQSLRKHEPFRRLLREMDIGKQWLEEESLRQITDEFIDVTGNTSEEEIAQQEQRKRENLSFEALRKELHRLEQTITDTKSFNREILGDEKDKDSYKTFIKVRTKEGKEVELSKFLVTNAWYDESGLKREHYDKKFNHPFKPVVGVSYEDARQFCDYLNKQNDGYRYALPDETIWQYEASGCGENWKYAWGDTWNANYCNNSELQTEGTTIVGAFKVGNSKNKLCDMNGNTWEWQENQFLRGGSWYSDAVGSRSSNRDRFNPDDRDTDVGFRLLRTLH
jgi:predicted KAP-like P-loop ATPase